MNRNTSSEGSEKSKLPRASSMKPSRDTLVM
jgi:hypothetical protein